MTRLVLAALVLLNCASFTTKLFAQASQTAPPVPLTPPSVNTTTVTCQINCDSQAMFCQNSCVPTTAAATSGATGSMLISTVLVSSLFANSGVERPHTCRAIAPDASRGAQAEAIGWAGEAKGYDGTAESKRQER